MEPRRRLFATGSPAAAICRLRSMSASERASQNMPVHERSQWPGSYSCPHLRREREPCAPHPCPALTPQPQTRHSNPRIQQRTHWAVHYR